MRMRGLWICPRCLKDYEGFQRFNKCPDCKVRLRFSVGESKTTLTTCEKCHETFDFSKQKEVAPGAVKCPKCGAVVNQKGHLIGKQEGKLNETVDGKEWQWHCSRCHSIHMGTEGQSACPKCGSELTYGTLPGSHESASEGRMLCEGFHVQKIFGGGWRLSKRLTPARQTKKANTKKEEFDSKKFRSFRGAEWTAPNSDSKCRLCGRCGGCDKEGRKGAELDKQVRSYVLDYFARLHG